MSFINHRITNYCTNIRQPMKFVVDFCCFVYVFFSGLWITELFRVFVIFRSTRPEVFLRKGVLKINSQFTGEHPCRSVISIKLLCRVYWNRTSAWVSPVNLLHIFRTPFPKNTYGGLLLYFWYFPKTVIYN